MSRKNLLMLFLVTAVVGTVADLTTKYWAFESLGAEFEPHEPETFHPGETLVLIDGCFDISCAINTGVAFSALRGKRWLIMVFSLVAMGVVLVIQLKLPAGAWGRSLALGGIAAGAVGNLYDRYLYGVVRDFIHVWYQDWHYPFFNVADMLIVLGAIGIILAEFRRKPDKAEDTPSLKTSAQGGKAG